MPIYCQINLKNSFFFKIFLDPWQEDDHMQHHLLLVLEPALEPVYLVVLLVL